MVQNHEQTAIYFGLPLSHSMSKCFDMIKITNGQDFEFVFDNEEQYQYQHHSKYFVHNVKIQIINITSDEKIHQFMNHLVVTKHLKMDKFSITIAYMENNENKTFIGEATDCFATVETIIHLSTRQIKIFIVDENLDANFVGNQITSTSDIAEFKKFFIKNFANNLRDETEIFFNCLKKSRIISYNAQYYQEGFLLNIFKN